MPADAVTPPGAPEAEVAGRPHEPRPLAYAPPEDGDTTTSAWHAARWIGLAWSLGVIACTAADVPQALLELISGPATAASLLAWVHALALPAAAAVVALLLLRSAVSWRPDRALRVALAVAGLLFILWPAAQLERSWYSDDFPAAFLRSWGYGHVTTHGVLVMLWRKMWQIAQWTTFAMFLWATLAPGSATQRRLILLAVTVILLSPVLFALRMGEMLLESPGTVLKYMFTIGSLLSYIPPLLCLAAALLAIRAIRRAPVNVQHLRIAAAAFVAALVLMLILQPLEPRIQHSLGEWAVAIRNLLILATPVLALVLYRSR